MKTHIDYTHLLDDHTSCHDIDTSGSASEHELGDLARLDGHASLTSCLNDWNAWSKTVSEVAEMILGNRLSESDVRITEPHGYTVTLENGEVVGHFEHLKDAMNAALECASERMGWDL